VRLSARRIDAVAYGLIGLQLVLRGWAAGRGYFHQDDFVFMSRVAADSFDLRSFFEPAVGDHLIPGALFLVWLPVKIAPMNFGVVVAELIVLQLAVDVAVYWLLRELFGRRPAVLGLLTIFLVTPLTLTSLVWWVAAISHLPLQLALALALHAHVRYLRTGQRRYGWYGALAVAGALAFWERSALIAPFLFVFTVFFFTAGRWWTRPWTALRRHWPVWAAHVAVVALFAVAYALATGRPGTSSPGVGDVLRVVDVAREALVPTLFGGPWRWFAFSTVTRGFGIPPDALAVASTVMLLGLIGLTIYRRGATAVAAWVLAGGYLVAAITIASIGRFALLDAFIGLEYRYYVEMGVVVVVCAGVALFGVDRSTAPAPRPLPGWMDRALVPVAAVLVAVVVVGSIVSTVTHDRLWHGNPARPFVENARSDLRDAGPGVVLAETPVAESIIWEPAAPENTTRQVVGLVPEEPRFLEVGEAVERLWALDEDGRLREATVSAGLDDERDPTVQIDYAIDAPATGVVEAGGIQVPVELEPGGRSVFVRVPGPVGEVEIVGVDPLAGLRVERVTVGSVVPSSP
jgi:hypothetical protein